MSTEPNQAPLIAPLPGPADDADRRDHTRMRRRILDGLWRWDLTRKLLEFFPTTTVDRLGHMDQSRNLLGTVAKQLAVLYSEPPVVSHPSLTGEPLEAFLRLVSSAGTWQLAQRWQRYSWGLRECLVRVSWVGKEPGAIQVRIVTPDMAYCEAPQDSPDEPTLVVEARLRVRDGKHVWTWDVLDCRDPANPTYRVTLADGKDWTLSTDITAEMLGGDFDGANYPYRIEGKPVVPYVLYHAMRSGKLWDPYEGKEGVDGTLHVAALWSFWSYCVRDASYPIRYGIDVLPVGGARKGDGETQRTEVAADPTVLLMLRSDGTRTPILGQWDAGADPERLQLAIDAYELRTLTHMGLSVGDLQRTGGSGDSGYAISLRREAVRDAQRQMGPQMRRGDERLIGLMAGLANRYGGARLPETGWSIVYPGMPMSPEETKARLEEVSAEVDLGVASLVDVYLTLHPGTTREGAVAALRQIRIERGEFASQKGTM